MQFYSTLCIPKTPNVMVNKYLGASDGNMISENLVACTQLRIALCMVPDNLRGAYQLKQSPLKVSNLTNQVSPSSKLHIIERGMVNSTRRIALRTKV